MHAEDLNIEKEIVPVFDNYLNRLSREALLDFFNKLPVTIQEIHDRQLILSAAVNGLDHIQTIASYKRDIEEGYLFTSAILTNYPVLGDSNRNVFFTFEFRGKTRDHLVSRAIQLTFTLNRIYHHYFKNLNIAEFPLVYQPEIRKMADTLLYFNSVSLKENFLTGNASASAYFKVLKEIYSKTRTGELNYFWHQFFRFDAYISIAATISKRGFCFPDFEGAGIEVQGLYHPLVAEPVKNNVVVKQGVMLLTGPNMSGKSTLLKSVSLCVYLAHLGLAVPADKCSMQFFSSINVFLNIKDELQSGLSHFMTELKRMKGMVMEASAGETVFAVFDEVYSGTDIDDAHELFKLTVQGLEKYPGCCFILSTHFNYKEKIEEMKSDKISAFYLDAEIDGSKPVFTYKVKKGWSRQKFGLLLFESEGLRKMLE